MKNLKVKYCNALNLDTQNEGPFLCTSSEDNSKWFLYFIEEKKLEIFEYSDGMMVL